MESSSSKKWTEQKNDLMMEFDKLLDSIDSANTKEKILWRQIYENAISDRNSANLCFLDVYPHLRNDMDNHIQVGQHAVLYLTRMEKSNEQLLKLATIIQKALENQKDIEEEGFSSDGLLDEIQKQMEEEAKK